MNRARTWLNTITENTVLEKAYEEATFGDQQNGTSRSPSTETLFSTAVGSLLQIVQARASDTPGLRPCTPSFSSQVTEWDEVIY